MLSILEVAVVLDVTVSASPITFVLMLFCSNPCVRWSELPKMQSGCAYQLHDRLYRQYIHISKCD